MRMIIRILFRHPPRVPASGKHAPMSTLTSEPVASLIARLFAAADAQDANLRQRASTLSPQQRQAMMSSTTEYREFYGQVKDFYLAVSPETARLLYMLARSIRARSIVEFGTSFGISTIHMAAALRDNGGGRLIGSDFESGNVEKARANLQAAQLSDLVESRE